MTSIKIYRRFLRLGLFVLLMIVTTFISGQEKNIELTKSFTIGSLLPFAIEFSSSDSQLIIGKYKNGNKEGWWYYFLSNGTVFYKSFYENGKMIEEDYPLHKNGAFKPLTKEDL
jgi:antitoxin component YwqK of YwqJK toxin-antitoxin module